MKTVFKQTEKSNTNTIFILMVIFVILFNLIFYKITTAQISTFPYIEDFESDNGSFTTRGTNSTWAWGCWHKNQYCLIRFKSLGN